MQPGRRSIDVHATLCVLGATLCWAAMPLFLKYLTAFIPDGWTTNGYRYPLAALVYLPWLVLGVRRGKIGRSLLLPVLVPSAVNLAAQCLWAWAPYFIDPGLMAFAVRLSVVWSAVTAFVLFHDERALLTSKRFWSGSLLAVAGFGGMALWSDSLGTAATTAGLVIMFACSLFWGMYAVAVRWAMKQTDAPTAFGLVCVYTALGTIVLMLAFGQPARILTTPPLPLSLLVLSALVGIATAHVLFYAAIKRIGVAIASSVNLSGALLTGLAGAWLFPDERLNAAQWFSGMLLLVGAMLLLWSQERLRPPAESAATG